MAKAQKKNPAIDELLTKLTGKDRVKEIGRDRCVICGGEATEFKDELSRREYSISGMCQKCQDSACNEEMR